MMWLILNLIAEIIKWVLCPFFYVYGSLCAINRREWKMYNKQLALVKDQYGNVLLQYPLNKCFIKPSGYKSGNRKETISSVFGKNEMSNTNTKLGTVVVKGLNILEKKHCEKSIDYVV